MIDRRRLSKTMSHALRHDPLLYGIEIDSQGWTDLPGFLTALRQHRRAWAGLTRADLEGVVNGRGKKRYQIDGDRIRALYGHSKGVLAIEKQPTQPPDTLYHGTTAATVSLIKKEGLKPMNRQVVHHSTDVETAQQVGRRKGVDVIILRVDARAAYEAGIRFYEGNEQVWLSDAVPPAFIEFSSVGS